MSQFMTETTIHKGCLELHDLPLQDNLDVTVIVIPKVDLTKMSFPEIWTVTESFRGNLADEVSKEREER